MKDSIDNILVVDLPRLQKDNTGQLVQESDRPEPYYYLLDIDNIIDVVNTKVKSTSGGPGEVSYFFKTEYIIFRGLDADNKPVIYVFDDTFYRVFDVPENGDPVLREEIAHNLMFCPARSFWTTPLNSCSNVQKKSPITPSLSELDWLLFFKISQQYLELYAPFPIYALYKQKCNYEDEAKRSCNDGYLLGKGEVLQSDPKMRKKCPRCSTRLKVGAGAVLLIDVPKDDDPDLMANPMKVIPAERESLDYMRQAIEANRNSIFENCVGRGAGVDLKQAQNEVQIVSAFESQLSVLFKIKRNFEIAQLFVLDTVARLRYGTDYKDGKIDYGTEFFFKTEEEQTDSYKKAVDAGLPEYDLAQRRDDIDRARYRNNPNALERNKILRNLMPFPDHDMKSISELRKQAPEIVPIKDMVIKLNFNAFIDRFEREQTNVLIFASALTFDKKISLIGEELETYADEYLAEAEEDKPEPPAPEPGSGIPPAGGSPMPQPGAPQPAAAA